MSDVAESLLVKKTVSGVKLSSGATQPERELDLLEEVLAYGFKWGREPSSPPPNISATPRYIASLIAHLKIPWTHPGLE